MFAALKGKAVTIHQSLAAPRKTLLQPVLNDRKNAEARISAQQRFAHYVTRPILRLGPLAYAVCIVSILGFAWVQRNEGHLTAESGLGYWLGIIGAVLMLMLVGYPLRKRLRSFQRLGRVAGWFRLHMAIGILAPALIILHSNFKLGSLNSRLALATMLIVVMSGIVGRYIYAKVHKGLYGRQLVLRDIHSDLINLKQGIYHGIADTDVVDAELQKYIPKQSRTSSVGLSLISSLLSAPRALSSQRRISRELKKQLGKSSDNGFSSRKQRRKALKAAEQQLRLFFAAVKKAERLAFFEKVFGMWHHLHVPLFVMLILTVALHVVAVHLY